MLVQAVKKFHSIHLASNVFCCQKQSPLWQTEIDFPPGALESIKWHDLLSETLRPLQAKALILLVTVL